MQHLVTPAPSASKDSISIAPASGLKSREVTYQGYSLWRLDDTDEDSISPGCYLILLRQHHARASRRWCSGVCAARA